MFGDSGNQGWSKRGVKCLLPKKKVQGQLRSEADVSNNKMLSRHRILVEHVYYRIKDWQILRKKWRRRLKTSHYLKQNFFLCASLTNLKNKTDQRDSY